MDVRELGHATWTEIGEPIVVVPVGSCEQHGPHLPLDTDTIVASTLARDLVARRDDCVLAPPLARSADWAAGVVFVNGHGGNVTAMQRAADVFEHERRPVLVWWPDLADADPHAGHTETSLMLAIAPDRVRMAAATAGPVPELADLVRHGIRPLSPSGVLGDPTEATAEAGAVLLHRLADQLAAAVADWAG